MPDSAVKSIYVKLPSALGASKSLAFTARINSVDTAVTATVANLNTTANGSSTVPISAGSNFTIKIVAAGSSLPGLTITHALGMSSVSDQTAVASLLTNTSTVYPIALTKQPNAQPDLLNNTGGGGGTTTNIFVISD
jgi:hypothetical protein